MATLISCREALEKMAEAIEGLPAPELSQHLASCEDCLARWKALEAVHALLEEAPSPEPPPGFKAGVMASIRRESALRRFLRIAAAFLLTASGGVALILALVFIAYRVQTLLLAARILLGMSVAWFWRLRGLLELLLEMTPIFSGPAVYFATAFLAIVAALANILRRRFRHEVA